MRHPFTVSPHCGSLSQGVQRERLAHVSCLQGVVGYTATDADRLSNILLAGGGVCSESVFPQWRLRGNRVLPRGPQNPGQCIFVLSDSNLLTDDLQELRKRGVSLYCCVVVSRRKERDSMANYAILRIEKHKIGSVTRINNHHERLKEKYKSNEDIDLERTHLNYHLVEPEGKYRQKVFERIEEVGAKRRRDSVVLQDVLITASPDWIDAKSYDEQVEYFNHAFDFIADRYGRDNILSAVVHMDEAHPHMHLVFVPITSEGKLSSKILMGGPKGMEKLQDDFHEHMSRKYPDLTRGISKKITKRRHISPQMYKQAASLYKHYDQILEAINSIGMIGNAKAKEDAVELLGRYAPELAIVKDQLESTKKYIEMLEGKLSYSEMVIRNRNSELNEKEQALFEERSKVNELEYKQEKLVGLLNKIPPEMRDELLKGKQKERESR